MRAATVGAMVAALGLGLGSAFVDPAGAQLQFETCAEVYALGWGDIEPDEPGYSLELDVDGDGFACELNGDDDAGAGATTSTTVTPSSTSTTTSTTVPTPTAAPSTTSTVPATTTTALRAAGAASTTTPLYANCAAAAALGVTNIGTTNPGYRLALDSDQDGIACESGTAVAAAVLPFTGARDVTWILGGAAVGLGLAWTVSSRRRLRPIS